MVFNPTNSPRNFAGQSGSIVPVRLVSPTHVGTDFMFSFATATGKTYNAEFKTSFAETTWQTFLTVAGNGALNTVTNQTGVASQRFYRLRVQ